MATKKRPVTKSGRPHKRNRHLHFPSIVARLKERGFESPYLKAFVVARVNPLRFMKGAAPPFDDLLAQMTKRASGLDPGKVRGEDVARSGGPPAEAEA